MILGWVRMAKAKVGSFRAKDVYGGQGVHSGSDREDFFSVEVIAKVEIQVICVAQLEGVGIVFLGKSKILTD